MHGSQAGLKSEILLSTFFAAEITGVSLHAHLLYSVLTNYRLYIICISGIQSLQLYRIKFTPPKRGDYTLYKVTEQNRVLFLELFFKPENEGVDNTCSTSFTFQI